MNKVYLEAGIWNLYLKKLKSKLSDESPNTTTLNINTRIVIRSLEQHPELLVECMYFPGISSIYQGLFHFSKDILFQMKL